MTTDRSGPVVAGGHAIVIGAGVAGLCAARVLADAFERVTILDRDALPSSGVARSGAPQGHHVHAILVRGTTAVRELFPGLIEEMVADGVVLGDVLADSHAYLGAHRLKSAASGLTVLGVTRPRLEYSIRRRVSELPNVHVQVGHVDGLTFSDAAAVTGVRLRPSGAREPAPTLGADLVVDASGRGSRAVQWLTAGGYDAPAEQRLRIDLAYSSCTYAVPDGVVPAALGILVTAGPASPRGGAMSGMGNGEWLVSLSGYGRLHPPVQADAFLDFAQQLAVPDIYDVLRQARPTSAPVRYRIPETVRRRYDRLKRFPENFVVLGDAVCSFNPVYGQGMSVAADQALILGRHLQRHGAARFTELRAPIARAGDAAWTMSVNSDLRMPWIRGRRTPAVRLGNTYLRLLHRAAHHDAQVARAFMRVANLMDPMTNLARPSIAGRIVVGSLLFRRRVRRMQRATTLTPPSPGTAEAR